METAQLQAAIREFIIATETLGKALNQQYLAFLKSGLEKRQSHVLLRTLFLEIIYGADLSEFAKSHLHLMWSFWQPPTPTISEELEAMLKK